MPEETRLTRLTRPGILSPRVFLCSTEKDNCISLHTLKCKSTVKSDCEKTFGCHFEIIIGSFFGFVMLRIYLLLAVLLKISDTRPKREALVPVFFLSIKLTLVLLPSVVVLLLLPSVRLTV